jgi:hypothetical protein
MQPETATEKTNVSDDFSILIRRLICELRIQNENFVFWPNSFSLKDRFWPFSADRASIACCRSAKFIDYHDRPDPTRRTSIKAAFNHQSRNRLVGSIDDPVGVEDRSRELDLT